MGETQGLATILATVRNDIAPHMGVLFVGTDRFGMVADRSLHEIMEAVFANGL